MRRVVLGNTGLEVGVAGLGCGGSSRLGTSTGRREAESIAAKLEIVPNGLDLPAAADAPGRGALAVGRLIAEKGMDVAIEAAAAAGIPLTIAGDGPERAKLEALAAARGGVVRFEGVAPRERLAALYREAGCVVLAARRGEGLPNVLLEAMAHGRPVIATPVMGVADLVRPEENGLLVPTEDVHALAAAGPGGRLRSLRRGSGRRPRGRAAPRRRAGWRPAGAGPPPAGRRAPC